MRPIQRVISIGFATAAIAAGSMPALSWTVWPDVDFEWYADVGKPLNGTTVELQAPARAGYIWAPAHWETRGVDQVWIKGHYVRDDYESQIATYGNTIQLGDDVSKLQHQWKEESEVEALRAQALQLVTPSELEELIVEQRRLDSLSCGAGDTAAAASSAARQQHAALRAHDAGARQRRQPAGAERCQRQRSDRDRGQRQPFPLLLGA